MCTGPLTPDGDGAACAVGHAFTSSALERHRLDEVRRSLWAAVHALASDASGLRSLARGDNDERRLRLAEESLRHSDTLRELALTFDQRADAGGPAGRDESHRASC